MSNNQLLNQYSEKDVIDANRKVYTNITATYEDVVFTGDANNRLKFLLSNTIEILKETKQDILALDACGGTGQASFMLNDLGCETHLVDLSSEMIANMKKRCSKNNIKIKTINSEINEFFKNNKIKYDLIVFSSALHHLRLPAKVLILAMESLSKGGILLTISDPTINIQKRSFKILSFLDRTFNHLLINPLVPFKLMFEKIYGNFSSKNGKERDQGWLSEFHTVYGINDEELIEELVQNKNYILFHKRYTAGYTWFFQKVYKIFKFRTSFLLLVSNEELKNISTKFEIQ